MSDEAGSTGSWAGVRERVLALRAAPSVHKVFGATPQMGASGHGFELAPPMTEAELLAAERRLGVTLPGEYRGFLLEAGAFGTGPGYGLMRLTAGDGERTGKLRRPFNPDVAPLLRQWDEAAGNARREEALDEQLTAGKLRICHHGCGYYTLLVVTGPERGNLWEDMLAGDGGMAPTGHPDRTGDGGRTTFGRWYLDWLAVAEQQANGGGPRAGRP
jgi:hypothetical protein